jgi:tRNA modification GTPase
MVLQETLGNIRVHTEAALDFPEEDIDFLVDAALLQKIEQCAAAFDRLLAEAGAGRILRDGLRMVIVGRPNAGKSSLLNVRSGQEAAIVTEIAGTTRDILRERINIDGLSVELVDTAGLRDDPDRIEEEGIRRAREAMAGADAILWIEDALVPQGNETAGAIGDLEPGTDATKPMIRVRNKIDLTGEAPQACSEAATVDGNTVPARVSLSAKTGAGIELLRPNHMMNAVPVVMVRAANRLKPQPGDSTIWKF